MTIHLCGTIKEAQSCMENGYDLHQKDREFEERDWVLFKGSTIWASINFNGRELEVSQSFSFIWN